jgi:uncharacterized protein YndB with AHSA1/START domain
MYRLWGKGGVSLWRVSVCRRQALLGAPVESVWELVGNPDQHPRWWPRVLEVDGRRFEPGDRYVQVTRGPIGRDRTTFEIERMEDFHEVRMRCLHTGMYSHWQLTAAQDGTFVDVEFGIEPQRLGDRLFDRLAGRAYFRRWAEQSLDALGEAARVDDSENRA